MKCEICGNGTNRGPLWRVNVGVLPARWRHDGCDSDRQVPPETLEDLRDLVDLIDQNDPERGAPGE